MKAGEKTLPRTRRRPMRVLVIVKATKDSENGVMPTQEALLAMGKYNEELVKAGVMLDGAGLKPSKFGARVRFSGDKRAVVDGPFPETKELIAGYWIWQVKDLQEAVEWLKRCPNPMLTDSEIEIRPYFEPSDFEMTDATKEQHEKVAAELAKKGTAHGVA
jgi:hypothetical protein